MEFKFRKEVPKPGAREPVPALVYRFGIGDAVTIAASGQAGTVQTLGPLGRPLTAADTPEYQVRSVDAGGVTVDAWLAESELL
jgi:hypothetical protein